MCELAPDSPWNAIFLRFALLRLVMRPLVMRPLLITDPLAWRAPFPNPPACRRPAARYRRWRHRCACRPRVRAIARAFRVAPAATAAASRNAPARRGDRHKGRCDDRAAPRPRAPWRG